MGAFEVENEESGLLRETEDTLALTAPLRVARDTRFAKGLETGRANPIDDAVALALSPSGSS